MSARLFQSFILNNFVASAVKSMTGRKLYSLRYAWIILFAALFPAHSQAQNTIDPSQVQVQFVFEPNIVEPGRVANLSLRFIHEVRGNIRGLRAPGRIDIPQVAGLEVQALQPQTAQQTSINSTIGMKVTYTVTYPFRVRAEKPGFYTISPFVVEYLGGTYRIAGATLEVIDTTNSEQAPPVLMDLILPQEKVFVGETVKATVQVWVKEEFSNFQVSDPSKVGTAFSEGARSRQEIRNLGRRSGAVYNIGSWPVTITPIKGGDQTIQYEARVRLATGRATSVFDLFNQRFGLGSALNNSRLGATPGRNIQDVMVASEPRIIPVKPLPLKSQPDTFTGAIGEFGLRVTPSAGISQVGIPIQLTLDIIGEGNFNRISAPKIDLGRDWKSFEPESEFQAGDALSYSGRKRFRYDLIPTHEEVTAIPPIKFSYFDPVSESYKTLESGSIPVTVEPNPNAEDFSDYFAELEAAGDEGDSPAEELALSLGRNAVIPTPLAYAPAFQWSQLGALIVLLSGFGLIKLRQNMARDERRRRIQAATQRAQTASEQADAAMADEDPRAFLLAAAAEVRAGVSSVFGPQAEAWTAEEYNTRLSSQDALPESLKDDTCAFLSDVENTLFRSDANLGDFQYAKWKSKSSSLSSTWIKQAAASKGGRS